MHIIYCQKMMFPTHSAHAIHTIMTVGNMARAGATIDFFPAVSPAEPESLANFKVAIGFAEAMPNVRLHTCHTTHKGRYGIFFRLQLAKAMLAAKKHGAVCYASSVKEAALAISLRKWLGISPTQIPIVFEIHHIISQLKNGCTAKRLHKLEEKALRESDLVIYISNELHKHVSAYLPAPKASLVSPLGFNQNTIKPVRDYRQPEPGEPTEENTEQSVQIMYVGSLQSGKGVENLIEAMGMLPAHYHLTIIGAHPQGAYISLQEQAKALGTTGGMEAAPRISFAGQVPQAKLPEYLKKCDIFCIPISTTKDFFCPIKMYEALGFNLPVVSTPAPSIQEVLQNGVNAVFTADFTAPSLAAALRRLGDDASLRHEMRKNNAELAKKFEASERAKHLLKVCSDLLKS